MKTIRSQTVREEVTLFHYLLKKSENDSLSLKEQNLFTSLLLKYGTEIYKM